jgi:multidrug efflux pump subunit AcrB
VILDKDKMAENGIDPMGISQMIQANNSSSPSASFVNQDEEYLITTGKFLTSADVENLVVGLKKIGLFI